MEFLHQILDFLHQVLSPAGQKQLIETFGLLLLFGIIFAETGLLVGFFLPGDSLLFVAGFMARTTDFLNIYTMLPLLCVAAIAGDSVGYLIGRKMGPLLFSKPDSRFFKRAHLEKAHAFYEKHGSKTIVLARFVPIVRTFAPTVAGAAGMDYKQFIGYNIAGGVLWICSMLLGGYFLGHFIPADKLDKVVIVIVFISILPMIIHAVQEKRAAKREASARIRTGEGEAA